MPNLKKNNNPSVVVILSTYNGEKYIAEQLESLKNQSLKPSYVFVRDDGSSDMTVEILKKWNETTDGWLIWYQGENCGPAKSFMEAMEKAPHADYYSFCDQDDVWDIDKIEQAVRYLESSNKEFKVYVSNVALADGELKIYGQTKFRSNTTIQSALMYNQAIGCTMVINNALKNKIIEYKPEYMVMHDCWIYRVCASLGGELIFDKDYHMKYRQHEQNFSGGSKNNIQIWKKRIKSLFGRKKHMRKMIAKELLNGYGTIMPDDIRKIVNKFATYDMNFKNKRALLKDKEIYSESHFGNLGIKLSILFGML